jgi:dienelactone hydrolase
VALLLVGGACGDDTGSSTSENGEADATTSAPEQEAPVGPPYEIETYDETFTDTSRGTPELAGTGVPASDERTLITTVRAPIGEGPFPLIVFSHGVNGHPDKFGRLLDAWAAAGYVVAAPAFPLSSDRVPGEATVFDLGEQSGDVVFLLDELLARSHEPGDPLQGAIDNERIGLGGLSLGAATTYTTAFGAGYSDERIDAVVALSGLAVPVEDSNLDMPAFVAHSDDDPVLRYDSAVEMYEGFRGPAYMMTVFNGSHALAYEDNGHPTGPIIDLATTRFWDRYLKGDNDVPEQLMTEEELEGAAHLEGPDAP